MLPLSHGLPRLDRASVFGYDYVPLPAHVTDNATREPENHIGAELPTFEMGMNPFFYLSWLDEASVRVAEGLDDPERDRLLCGRDQVQDWSAPRLVVESDELVDYLPNNLGVRLCSMRMRDLIDANLPRDRVQWLPAEVIDIYGTSHDYFVLHVLGDDDVLNEARSPLWCLSRLARWSGPGSGSGAAHPLIAACSSLNRRGERWLPRRSEAPRSDR